MRGADRVKGVRRWRHPKTGIWYAYHRKTGTRLNAEWMTAEFLLEIAALDKKARDKEAVPGSLGELIIEFRKSPATWGHLAPATRFSYDRVFKVLKPLEEMPLKKITEPFLYNLRDDIVFAEHGRWMANYLMVVFGLLLPYAKKRGLMDANPLAGEKVKRIRAPQAEVARNRPWAWEECRAVLEAAPPHLGLPLALGMFAGFRKRDVLTMTKAVLKDGEVRVRTSKRGVNVWIPIHPELQAALAAVPANDNVTLCLTSRGDKWTESGFNSSFGKMIDRLELAGRVAPGLTFHGLRHTLGTRLKEAGATDQQIMDILGQKSAAMAKHYSENAETPKETKGLLLSIDPSRQKQNMR